MRSAECEVANGARLHAGQMLNITGCPFNKLLELTENIWLLNGGDAPFDHFMKSYPYIKVGSECDRRQPSELRAPA